MVSARQRRGGTGGEAVAAHKKPPRWREQKLKGGTNIVRSINSNAVSEKAC